jgi:uncharacterized protein
VLSFLATFIFAYFVFQFVGFVAGLAATGFDDQGLQGLLASPSTADAKFRTALLVMQGVSATGVFILAPLFFLYYIDSDKTFVRSPALSLRRWQPVTALGLVALLIVGIMPLSALVVEWNKGVKLPSSLDGFAQWATELEQRAGELTEFLLTLDSLADLGWALLVVAIIPAVGEELTFRGVLQTKLQLAVKNPHLAIWIFSLLHFQFFGFVPRVLLGALFGYLYWWSGNLLMPVMAHLVNNGFTVIMIYLHQRGMLGIDIEAPGIVPLSLSLASAGLTIGLLYLFRQINLSYARLEKVYTTTDPVRAELVRSILDQSEIPAIVVNKKDSSYQAFGEVEVHVRGVDVLWALKILADEVRFE